MMGRETVDHGSRQAWLLTFTVWLLLVFIVAYEIVPASLLPLVMEGLNVGPTAASWLVSALVLGMAVFSIPVGIVLDRIDNRRAIVLGTIATVLMMGWGYEAGRTGAYLSLLASRFLAGMTIVVVWTAGVNVVGAAFADERQATAIGVFATGVPAGFALGQFSGPLLAARFGWAGTFPVYGALAALAMGVYWLISRGNEPTATTSDVPTADDFRQVLTSRNVWIVSTIAFAAFSLNLIFNNWMPTYITQQFGVSLAEGGLLAAIFPAIGIVSRAASGTISDRLFDNRRRPIVLIAFGVVTPLVFGFGLINVVVILLFGLVVAGFLIQLGLGLLFTYVRELVAKNVVGTALAVLNAVGFLGGFSAPIITGTIIERTGDFTAVFVYAGVLAVISTVLAWYAPETDV
ncbi:MAG: MFS transporter [Halobacteriales archaeon]|nr:MFS transporter [Halobacteriales archaeon]